MCSVEVPTGLASSTDPQGARLRQCWARALRWTAAATFVLSVGVAWWAVEDDLPFVVGDVVVRPLLIGPAFAALATMAALAAAATGLAAHERGAAAGSRRWFVRWPVNLAKAGLLVAGWTGAAVAFLMGAAAGEPYLLDPPSPAGCRVLVVEHAYGAAAYVLPAGSFRAYPVWSDSGAAGLAPISLGRHALSWLGESADLELRGVGSGYDGVPYARATLDCAGA